jgi:light-regulated signal transduction histidine kinase (bacteriophytochrome)
MDQLPATRVLLVAHEKETSFRAVTEEAQRLAFPEGKTLFVSSFDAALKNDGGSSAEIIVLLRPDDLTVANAGAALDASGLPRWSIVVCDDLARGAEIEVVASSDWNARLVAQVFRGARERWVLRRENARHRGDLLSIGTRVVHDLRSPLGGVLTSAEVLKEILLADAPSNAVLTDSIVESVEGQMKLIRQLSLLAKASAQTHPAETFNMSAPFWSALQSVEKLARSKGATISQPKEWPEVVGSAALTETVWVHFLANAVVYSGPTPKIAAGWDRAENAWRFWVKSEIAAPAPKRTTLFMPFHQLHQPNAPRGWGLPIAHRFVELQGGKCGYESPPEGGALFYFLLPAANGP